MTNLEVAQLLERIADLLQLSEENPFKIRAYRNAARSITGLEDDLHDLYTQKRLKEIPGVGKTVQAHIEEILETGASAYFRELTRQIPETALEMLAVPGLGPKMVIHLYRELGLDNLVDLQAAAEAGRLRQVPGLGAKTEARVLKGIESLRYSRGKFSIGQALPLAEGLVRHLKMRLPGVEVSIVGSLRRGKPLVSDIDILVGCLDYNRVEGMMNQVAGLDIMEREPDRLAGYLPHRMPFEVILVNPREFAYQLFTSTGSKAHRARVLEGMTAVPPSVSSEFQIYQDRGLSYIPPELREDRGEIEAARHQKLPELVELKDIKGDLHVHSNWSDGSENLIDLVAAALSRGYDYLAITDHSHSLPITGGLNRERLGLQAQVIQSLNQQPTGVRLLKGIECDVLKDGSLDFSDADLEELDIVVASIHSHFHLDRQAQTERLLRVIENPHVDIIGHLTGQMLGKRPGYEVDLDRILQAAARYRKVLEINSHPNRLDIDEVVARRAISMGIKIAINSDAHHKHELDLLHYGILTARRGWLQSCDVINTWSLEEVLAYINS